MALPAAEFGQQSLHMNLRNDLRHSRQRRGFQGPASSGSRAAAGLIPADLSDRRPCASGEAHAGREAAARAQTAADRTSRTARPDRQREGGESSSTSKASSRSARDLGKVMLTGPCITVWIARDSDLTPCGSSAGSDAEVELKSCRAQHGVCPMHRVHGHGRSGTEHGLAPFIAPRECPTREIPPRNPRDACSCPEHAAMLNLPTRSSFPRFLISSSLAVARSGQLGALPFDKTFEQRFLLLFAQREIFRERRRLAALAAADGFAAGGSPVCRQARGETPPRRQCVRSRAGSRRD